MEEALKNRAVGANEPAQTAAEPSSITALAGRAADILIAETARCIRQYPLSAAAAAFGGGLLAGWLISRNLEGRHYAGREESRRMAFEDEARRRAISTWENEGGAYGDIPRSAFCVADQRP